MDVVADGGARHSGFEMKILKVWLTQVEREREPSRKKWNQKVEEGVGALREVQTK